MLPNEFRALLGSAFPGLAIDTVEPTVGGFSHQTLALRLGGSPCVIKAADAPSRRADLRREARVLTLLRGYGLPVPELLALAEDARWTLAVMERLPGTNALALYNGQLAEIENAARALGQLLAAVHCTALRTSDDDLLLSRRFEQVRTGLAALSLDADIYTLLVSSLEHPAWRPKVGCLVHGDAGFHNLLWDGGITALLDWEWSGMGNPLLDLAWIAWTLRWRQAPESLWPAFLAGYGDGPGCQCDDWHQAFQALVFGQMAGILTRVHPFPEARAEWLRRVRWTQQDLPGLV